MDHHWTLTISSGSFSTGVAVADPTNGSNYDGVADGDGNTEVMTEGVMLDVGPRITATRLTNEETGGDNVWDEVDDELTIIWDKPASHSSTLGVLSASQVNAILGTSVAFDTLTQVTLAGSGTDTWTLTVGGQALTTGVAEGEATNGTNNADVTDSDGNAQVETQGATLDVGPVITAVAASDALWEQNGDVLTITWDEEAFHAKGASAELTEEEVEAILDTDVLYGAGNPVVRPGGHGTTTWTLTIENEALDEGVAQGDPTNGTNNADVTDAADAPQRPATGITVS